MQTADSADECIVGPPSASIHRSMVGHTSELWPNGVGLGYSQVALCLIGVCFPENQRLYVPFIFAAINRTENY